MMINLIKRDPAWHMMLISTAVTAVLVLFAPAGYNRENVFLLETTLALGCGMSAAPHRRATLFEAALPIAGRRLYLARVLSLEAMVWLPVLAGLLVMQFLKPDLSLAPPLVEAASIANLAILLPLAVRVRELACPKWPRVLVIGLVYSFGVVAWDLLAPGVVVAACALASAAVFLKTWAAAPQSFQVAPFEAVDSLAIPQSTQTPPLLAWRPILRSAFWSLSPLYFLLMLPMAMFGSWFLFYGIFLIQGVSQSRQRTRWLYGLPLSYRALLWIALAPTLVPLIGGVAAGMLLGSPARSDSTLTAGPKHQSGKDIDVALEFWRRAPADLPPAIRAPWGETVRPTTWSVAGVTFYNPYSVGWENSERFQEWQFERATAAVYGRPITLREFGAANQAGLAPVTARPRMQFLMLAAALVFSLLLVLAVEFTRWRLVGRLSKAARGLLIAVLLGVPITLLCADSYYLMSHSSLGHAAIHGLLLRVSQLLPQSMAAAALVAAVPVLLAYWLLECQFRRSEMTGQVRPTAWEAMQAR
ncbi:MAG: hypothetical protein LAP87_16550 [Acidobacteriia bacterium]|nr:hypothetical protein [Terriglobia bacterium]